VAARSHPSSQGIRHARRRDPQCPNLSRMSSRLCEPSKPDVIRNSAHVSGYGFMLCTNFMSRSGA